MTSESGATAQADDRDTSTGEDLPAEVPDREVQQRNEEIEEPAKLLRIAHMIRSMLDEVKTTELDEAGRQRLAEIHNQTLEELHGIVSEDLREELQDVTAGVEADGAPSGAELRVAQAQLAGWLEGLFRGIQASMAAQARQSQQQIQAAAASGDESSRSGQYL